MSAANPGGPEAASTELIDRDMAAAMTKLAELVAADGGVPGSFEGDRAQLGRIDGFWNEGAPEVEIVLPLALPGARGRIEARLYKPTSSVVPVVLFMHGGGFVRGSVNHCDCVCRRLAAESGFAVISTTYSLAPEHPYPAALNDIVAILAGLPALADRHGLDTNRVLLSGGSAGASLAMSAALRQRDAGLPLPRGLALFYGAYDIANTSRESHRLFGDGRFGMSKARVDYYARALIPPGVSAADPYLSPIHADPAGLPPVWMGAAELDVLRDEQLEMAERLRAAAVSVEVRRYPGMIHGFVNRVRMVPMAATAISDAVRFLQAHA